MVYLSFFFLIFYFSLFFFFNDTATTEIYTLSLHDALPISAVGLDLLIWYQQRCAFLLSKMKNGSRSEEHTSELQSLAYLVCRLLLEKKKKKKNHLHQLTTYYLFSSHFYH